MIIWTRLYAFFFTIALGSAKFAWICRFFCLFFSSTKHIDTWLNWQRQSHDTHAIMHLATIATWKHLHLWFCCVLFHTGLLHHINKMRLQKIKGTKFAMKCIHVFNAHILKLYASRFVASFPWSTSCRYYIFFLSTLHVAFSNVYLTVISLLYWPLNVI